MERGRERVSPAGTHTTEVPAAGNSSHSDAVKTDVTQMAPTVVLHTR
jgi:hypothetical protein